jgi:hypothetical protein
MRFFSQYKSEEVVSPEIRSHGIILVEEFDIE